METCDELILWFGDGEYVEKALDLKRLYQPLTPAQEDKYKQFREKKGMVEISLPQSTERKNVIKEMVKTAECTSEEASETTVTASKIQYFQTAGRTGEKHASDHECYRKRNRCRYDGKYQKDCQ